MIRGRRLLIVWDWEAKNASVKLNRAVLRCIRKGRRYGFQWEKRGGAQVSFDVDTAQVCMSQDMVVHGDTYSK